MRSKLPIIADKELFRLWYEFYRLALTSSDKNIQKALAKSRAFYSDWGTDTSVHFDDWWRTHRVLFHDHSRVKLHLAGEPRSVSSIYVEVPSGKPVGELVEEFRLLLKSDRTIGTVRRKLPPTHRYAPTEIQGVKRDSLRVMLDLQKNVFSDNELKGRALTARVIKFFSSERYKKKQNEIPNSFRLLIGSLDHLDEADRNIRRYRQKASKLLLNVATGVFPGKYS